jgi:hypothetical protein
MDLADRKVVDWALSENMTTENTINEALRKSPKNKKYH